MPSGYRSNTNNRPPGTRVGPYGYSWKGNALKSARIQAGLNQDELAALAGVSRRTVIRAEKGEASDMATVALQAALCSKVS